MTEQSTTSGPPPWRVWTVPNALSLVRLLLVPVFAVTVLADHVWPALGLLVVAGLTDFLDGVIARRFDQISRLGQLLDPTADRLYILVTLIALGVLHDLPWWIIALLVARDLLLAVQIPILARHGYGPLQVHAAGKAATFLFMVAFPLLLLQKQPGLLGTVAWSLGWAAALWGLGLYWFSALVYLRQTWRVAHGDL